MRSIKKYAQWIEKPVTQELDQTDWVSLKDNTVNISTPQIPLLTGTTSAAYFDKDAVLPDKVFLLSDNEGYLVEDVNDKIVDIDTTQTLDIFGDNSCVAAYPLDGNANDLSGNYNGTINGTVGYTDAKFNQGYNSAADTSSNIQIPFEILGGSETDLTESVSFSVWYNKTTTQDGDAADPVIQFGGTQYNIAMGLVSQKWRFHAEYDENEKYVDDTDEVVLGEWYHAVGVYDKTNNVMQLWVNGVKKGEIDITGFIANTGGAEACIGSTTNGQTSITSEANNIAAEGIIDQVRIYKKALTEDEIKALYAEQSKKYDASELNFTANINKAYSGTNIFMTLGTGHDNNTELNKLRDYIQVDVANSDVTNGKLALFRDVSNEPIVNIDGFNLKPNIVDTIDTVQTLDVLGDGSAVATYTFDDQTANDLSGNYSGSWSGTEAYADGVFGGKAASFDGNSKILTGLSSISTGKATVAFWMRMPELPTQQMCIWTFSKDLENTLNLWARGDTEEYMYLITNNATVLGFDNTTVLGKITDKAYSGEWLHLAITSDGDIFLDGRLLLSGAFDPVDMSTINKNFVLGSDIDDDGNGNITYNDYYNGLLDQFRVFNRVLTEDEIMKLYYEQRSLIDTTSLSLTSLPKQVYLPYKRTVNVVDVTDNKVTVMENPKPGKNIKALIDGELIDVVSVDVDDTARVADVFGDGSNVATYTFDNQDATDLNGSYDGTENGTINYVEALFGGSAVAIDSDGSTVTRIDYPLSVVPASNTARSISVWVRMYSNGSGKRQQILAMGQQGTSNSVFDLEFNPYDGSADRTDNTLGIHFWNDGSYFEGYTLPLEEWVHIVISHAGGDASPTNTKLYINGAQTGTLSKTVSFSTDNPNRCYTGTRDTEYSGVLEFHGEVDQLRIFNRALTEDEIKALYTEGKQTLELAQTPSTAITTIDVVNDTKSLPAVAFKPTTAQPIGSETAVDAIEITFDDYEDTTGYRAVQRGLVLQEENVEVIEPFTSTVTKISTSS